MSKWRGISDGGEQIINENDVNVFGVCEENNENGILAQ